MNTEQQKKYSYWQWRTLIILMIGYILYYFVRKNFSAALPAMEAELGISKLQLGIFITLNGIIYGLSRFINGFIADRCSRRLMMASGLALSAIINFAICFSPSVDGFIDVLDTEGKATLGLVYLIGGLWVINGYVHGMGYPPCASLMPPSNQSGMPPILLEQESLLHSAELFYPDTECQHGICASPSLAQ